MYVCVCLRWEGRPGKHQENLRELVSEGGGAEKRRGKMVGGEGVLRVKEDERAVLRGKTRS